MKNKNMLLALLFAFGSICSFTGVKGQTAEAPASPFKVTADLVSSYVWRGVLSTPTATPNFQPTLAFTKGPVEIGVWGSTDFSGIYKEVDIYASITAGAFKFTLTDYDWNFKTRYFNYKNDETDHVFEGSVAYTGSENFPISLSANIMFSGADKKATDPTKQAYSTYIEVGYAFANFSPFLGISPSDGYYGDGYGGAGFGVVNLGVTSTKNLKFSDSYSLPIKASFIVNPQKEDIHLVFGITF
jgi:hypothetical protein